MCTEMYNYILFVYIFTSTFLSFFVKISFYVKFNLNKCFTCKDYVETRDYNLFNIIIEIVLVFFLVVLIHDLAILYYTLS